MAHARQQIRDAVVTALGSTGYNVFANRVNPYLTLPSLNVLTNQEDVRDDLGSMDDIQIRELRLIIECRDIGSDTDDKLDVIIDAVVEAVLSDLTIRGLVFDITDDETSFSYSRDGANPIGLAEITFIVLYQTYGDDPSTIIS